MESYKQPLFCEFQLTSNEKPHKWSASRSNNLQHHLWMNRQTDERTDGQTTRLHNASGRGRTEA